MGFNRRNFLTGLMAGGAVLAGNRLRALPQQLNPVNETGLAHDQDRPEFHLLAPHNWMNDPNGPIWWRGQYHLFYQMNPGAALWGDMHWGHAVSPDMIHWRHRPIALAPTPGGPDSAGCFTGSAVVRDGVPTLIYTGITPAPPEEATLRNGDQWYRETQLLATAADSALEHWTKQAKPVVATPPAGLHVLGFRDPCPWREADGWYMVVGSGERGGNGLALLYRSQDLRTWEYLHPLAEGNSKQAADPGGRGEMWECPDFFEVNGRWCLLHSQRGQVSWNTGEYDRTEHRFHITRTGLLDQGSYYAPKSFRARDGRRILWGWIPEARPKAELVRAGWAGAMSLPRELKIGDRGQLEYAIAREAQSLRETGERVRVQAGQPYRRKLASLRLEAQIPVSLTGDAVTVRLSQGGQAKWELTVDSKANVIRVGEKNFPLPVKPWPQPHLHLFFDGSVVESFIGGLEAVTNRVYGLKAGEAELEIEFAGKDGLEARLWPLKAISADRLTS